MEDSPAAFNEKDFIFHERMAHQRSSSDQKDAQLDNTEHNQHHANDDSSKPAENVRTGRTGAGSSSQSQIENREQQDQCRQSNSGMRIEKKTSLTGAGPPAKRASQNCRQAPDCCADQQPFRNNDNFDDQVPSDICYKDQGVSLQGLARQRHRHPVQQLSHPSPGRPEGGLMEEFKARQVQRVQGRQRQQLEDVGVHQQETSDDNNAVISSRSTLIDQSRTSELLVQSQQWKEGSQQQQTGRLDNRQVRLTRNGDLARTTALSENREQGKVCHSTSSLAEAKRRSHDERCSAPRSPYDNSDYTVSDLRRQERLRPSSLPGAFLQDGPVTALFGVQELDPESCVDDQRLATTSTTAANMVMLEQGNQIDNDRVGAFHEDVSTTSATRMELEADQGTGRGSTNPTTLLMGSGANTDSDLQDSVLLSTALLSAEVVDPEADAHRVVEMEDEMACMRALIERMQQGRPPTVVLATEANVIQVHMDDDENESTAPSRPKPVPVDGKYQRRLRVMMVGIAVVAFVLVVSLGTWLLLRDQRRHNGDSQESPQTQPPTRPSVTSQQGTTRQSGCHVQFQMKLCIHDDDSGDCGETRISVPWPSERSSNNWCTSKRNEQCGVSLQSVGEGTDDKRLMTLKGFVVVASAGINSWESLVTSWGLALLSPTALQRLSQQNLDSVLNGTLFPGGEAEDFPFNMSVYLNDYASVKDTLQSKNSNGASFAVYDNVQANVSAVDPDSAASSTPSCAPNKLSSFNCTNKATKLLVVARNTIGSVVTSSLGVSAVMSNLLCITFGSFGDKDPQDWLLMSLQY